MRERPIPFSAPMVRAILSGAKVQTRRVVKPQPRILAGELLCWKDDALTDCQMAARSPYGQPGDRLWVREAWRTSPLFDDKPPRELPDFAPLRYEADEALRGAWAGYGYGHQGKYRPPMFMPRWASRINLEVTVVRVERLQNISEADAAAEGVEEWARVACAAGNPYGLTSDGYVELLWSEINGRASWDANPWVWCVEFKRAA